MSGPRFAEIRARAQPRAGDEKPQKTKTDCPPVDDDEPEDELQTEEEDEMSDTNEKPKAAELDAARAEARKDERARLTAVFASEHIEGREKAAAKLLASTDMSADDIVAMLPDLSPNAKAEDVNTENADGELMMKNMKEANGANLGAGGGKEEQSAEEKEAKARAENYGWDKIHAEVDDLHKAAV